MIKTHSARIFRRSVQTSDYGTEVLGWVDLGNVDGFLDAIQTSKEEVAGKVIQDSTHIFITYEIEDIKQGDRLKFNGVTYEINFVINPAMMNHHLEIELKLIPEQDSQTEIEIYFGNVKEINESTILSLDSQIMKTKTLLKEIDVSDGKFAIVYPKSLGKSSIRLRDKLVTDWIIEDITINGITNYCYNTKVTSGTLKIELF